MGNLTFMFGVGKFAADGTPRDIPPHNPWMLTIGIFLIYTGFWGFYAACNVPMIAPEGIDGQITGVTWTATNIYLAPTTLGAITFNFLMSLSGGLMAAYLVSKGDAFWTFSGGLAGVITASAGNDLYHPIQAMLVGAVAAEAGIWAPLAFLLAGLIAAPSADDLDAIDHQGFVRRAVERLKAQADGALDDGADAATARRALQILWQEHAALTRHVQTQGDQTRDTHTRGDP